MSRIISLFMLAILLGVNSIQADPLTPEQVPEPLKPWINWVLHDDKQFSCPFLYNSFQKKRCAWPAQLKLDLLETEGRFESAWQVFRSSWILLPGDKKHWPQQVKLNGKPAIVAQRYGKPALRIQPGQYRISGEFRWDYLPDSLTIPDDTGLIQLAVKQRSVPIPAIKNGQIWLKNSTMGSKKLARKENKLQLEVFRKITDDVPLQVETRLDLQVSGDQREIRLSYPLLNNFTPLRLDSRLPARLETDGSLLLQIRPGRWQITVAGRLIDQVTELHFSTQDQSWPQQEIWVFDAKPYQRVVEVQNVTAIDSSQTRLPGNWQQFPAYQLSHGDTMKFNVVRRGDPEPEPDQLRLARKIWLDFDGQGYTFNDRINGKMTRNWRLQALPETILGRVELDGKSQLITRLQDSDMQGVEVRKGNVSLVADSRKKGAISQLSATGWAQNFHQVSAQLNLPPGWRLIAANGVDNVPQSWISKWTLLDLFLVLIISLAVVQLWSLPYGVLTLFTLVLVWHEPGAPQYVWLHILAATALLKVVPDGKFKTVIRFYRRFSWLVLLLIIIPFMVDQVRIGLYPQLERPWQQIAMQQPVSGASEGEAVPLAPAPQSRARKLGKAVVSSAAKSLQFNTLMDSGSEVDKISSFRQVDPNAKVQTGPGLPQWQWQTIHLTWNGSVSSKQDISLWYLSPLMSMLSNFLGVILLLLLPVLLFGIATTLKFQPNASISTCLLLAAMLLLPMQSAYADFPDKEMLKLLQQRLMEKPDCLPGCAQINHMQLQIDKGKLLINLQVDAIKPVAIPLPVAARQWFPQQVSVNKKSAQAMFRDRENNLWLQLAKGLNYISLSGPVTHLQQFTLALPLKPHQIQVTSQGWSYDGLRDHGNSDKQLLFNRNKTAISTTEQQKKFEEGVAAEILPPLLRVERTLHLGLHWRISNRVIRVSPKGAAIVTSIPLLPGESVTSANRQVKNGQIKVNLSAAQTQFSWESTLEQAANIELQATITSRWTEVWRLDISPIWHMQSTGIAVVHHQDKLGRWMPEWRPWPGEKINLNITRPDAVVGQTLTIDDSHLQIKPGKRVLQSTLNFNLRSSQGGKHAIRLPLQAELQTVAINGTSQPIRPQGEQLILPVKPGAQKFTLQWQQHQSISSIMTSPAVDLGSASVNHKLNMVLGHDRWVLFTFGPRFGPAVLIWGVLIVIAVLAWGLAKTGYTPLKFQHWLLLLIGLTQVPLVYALLVVGWLHALAYREKQPIQDRKLFNALQVGLAFFTILAIVLLFAAVQKGLLGSPDMHIVGNHSSAFNLNWYQDRSDATLPSATVVSIPLTAYRFIMLAWALWLAVSLLNWLQWGWQCFIQGGSWRKPEINEKQTNKEKQNLLSDD